MNGAGRLLLTIVLSCSLAYAGDNRWTSGGPYAGNIYEIVFQPANGKPIFATSGSGLHRSTDEGTSWKRVGDNAVVRFNPRDPKTLIMATTSIHRSTDQGETWQEMSNNPLDGVGFHDIEFNPDDPSILYSLNEFWGGATRRRVLKSTDGGTTWAPKLAKPLDMLEYDLAVDPTDGEIVHASIGGKVYKSTDAGESWRTSCAGMQTGLAYRLAVDPLNPRTIYAAGGPAYKSTDGGGTWSILAQNSFSMICVDPSTGHVYAAARGGVLKSTDGGGNWVQLDVDPEMNWISTVAVHPSKPNLVLAGGDGQGVFRSTNGGKLWLPANKGLDAMDAGCLLHRATGKGRLLTMGVGPIFESRNQGASWQPLSFGVTDSAAWHGQVHPKNPDLIAAAGYFDQRSLPVAISTNGGATWAFPYPTPGSTGLQVAWHPTDQSTLYVSLIDFATDPNTYLGIAKSTDRGGTWRFVNKGLTERDVIKMAFDPANASKMYAGTMSGVFFVSEDGGESWRRRGEIEGNQFRAIVPHPSRRDVIFAATSPGGLYSSTNGGKSWQSRGVSGSAAVAFSPFNPRTMLAGSSNGLVVSTDEGETWSNFDSNGLGNVLVRDILFDPTNAWRVFIGTTRGVFSYTQKTSPGGPVIEQLAPPYGKAGEVVTINGRSFGSTQGTSRVTFAGIDAGVAQAWSDTSIRVAAPSGVRTGPVSVTVGSKKSNTFEFIVLPATGSVEPTSGPASGGTKVTITPPPGTVSGEFNILFGSTLAYDPRMIAPDVIVCATPPGTGTVDVKVSTVLTTTTVGTFTYEAGTKDTGSR